VDRENKASVHAVKMGPRIGTWWVVDEGLKPGDRVVAEGVLAVKDGKFRIGADIFGQTGITGSDDRTTGNTFYNQLWSQAAAEGITVCVSTGDDGSEAQIKDGRAHVNYPASDPSVLAVGGTTLHRKAGPTPAIASEIVWNDGAGSGTGGGISDYIAQPAWQNGIVPPSINPTHFQGRGIPDVAADADPKTGYLTCSGGQFGVVGGTSASAPLWGALIALCNQELSTPQKPARVGNFNALLYSTIGPAQVLHDITKGNNDTDGLLSGNFAAKAGWDACTGWGTPDGQKLLNALK
jgi:kumamolisin